MPPSPSMINMHTQPMPVYINATATRPAPGRIHISANPNPLVTPVRPIYGQAPQQSMAPTAISSTFLPLPLQNQCNNFTTGSVNAPMRLSTGLSGIQPLTSQSISFPGGTENGAITLSPPSNAYQLVGHQSIPLRPAVINPAITSLPPASAFVPVAQQSIHVTPGSVNQGMTLSPSTSAFQSVRSQSNHLPGVSANPPIICTLAGPASPFQQVHNESIGVSANTAIARSPLGVPATSPVNTTMAMSPLEQLQNQSNMLAVSPVHSANVLQQGTMAPSNQFQSLTNPIGSAPNPLQGKISPHANQFQTLTNPMGSAPNLLQQGTMSPEGNQFNPIGSPAMTIEELTIQQSANMTPSVQMVASEVQMGEMAPTGQQVPIHILKKLDPNQLQQLQSRSPVPITENQLQEIQGGPVVDSQIDLFASGDEDQI